MFRESVTVWKDGQEKNVQFLLVKMTAVAMASAIYWENVSVSIISLAKTVQPRLVLINAPTMENVTIPLSNVSVKKDTQVMIVLRNNVAMNV